MSGDTEISVGGAKKEKWLLLVILAVVLGVCFFVLSHWRSAIDASGFYHYGLRVVIVAAALAAWFTTQSLIGSRGLSGGAIGDGIHDLTAPIHRYLLANPAAANGVLIVSSAFIDLFGLFLIGAALFGPTLRPFVALLILFAFRQVSQALCALPAPKDMIWRNPGFPSLLVTYGVGNDFFISGHTAIAVLGAIEMAHLFPWWVGAIAGVIAFLEAAVVITLRAHYTMDVLGAIVAAWCAASAASWLCVAI